MLKLRVAIRVVGAIVRFAIDLPRIFQLCFQQPGDSIGTYSMACSTQCRCQLCRALRHPFKRTYRITHRRWLGETLQVGHQRRIKVGDLASPSTLAAHAAIAWTWSIKIIDASPDGGTCEASDLRNCRKTATPRRSGFCGSKQTPTSFAKLRTKNFPSLLNLFSLYHDYRLPY